MKLEELGFEAWSRNNYDKPPGCSSTNLRFIEKEVGMNCVGGSVWSIKPCGGAAVPPRDFDLVNLISCCWEGRNAPLWKTVPLIDGLF